MKFLELRPEELSVLKSSVIGVERREEIYSRIYTNDGMVFDSELPYRIVLDILESSEDEKGGEYVELQRKIANSLATLEKNNQFFAG